MNEREALSFVLGMLAGMRDNPSEAEMMRALAEAAVAALLPRARELGLELDEEAWAVMEGR